MFSKIERTNFPPQDNPVMIWDGECGFCNYWITRWKDKTADRIEYVTFQDAASVFKDIPLNEFKKASRFIEPNGLVYSGPDSAFRSFTYFEGSSKPFHNWYQKYSWFTHLSDRSYNFITKHRGFMFTLSQLFFGKDPRDMKPYWFLILLFAFSTTYLFVKFL